MYVSIIVNKDYAYALACYKIGIIEFWDINKSHFLIPRTRVFTLMKNLILMLFCQWSNHVILVTSSKDNTLYVSFLVVRLERWRSRSTQEYIVCGRVDCFDKWKPSWFMETGPNLPKQNIISGKESLSAYQHPLFDMVWGNYKLLWKLNKTNWPWAYNQNLLC